MTRARNGDRLHATGPWSRGWSVGGLAVGAPAERKGTSESVVASWTHNPTRVAPDDARSRSSRVSRAVWASNGDAPAPAPEAGAGVRVGRTRPADTRSRSAGAADA